MPRARSAQIVINATPSCVAVLGLPEVEWLAALQTQLLSETEIVELDARAALVDSTDAGQTLIRIQANATLPPFALQRLLAAAGSVDDFDVISATDAGVDALSPLPEAHTFAGDARALDAACWLLGERSVRPCDAVIGALAWVGPDTAARIKSGQPLRHGVIDSLHVAAADTPLRGSAAPEHRHIAAPATALAGLRVRLGQALPLPTSWPGLDAKPVILHVLHGWGGGVERFARDLADGDHARTHLALFARGEFSRSRYGESLELALLRTDHAVSLARFDLAAPIATCAIESSEWRAAFNGIRDRFGVGAVIVSSLIGHSLDALSSGLPTEYVCHDYFPLWPILHADFGDSAHSFDRQSLGAALAGAKAPEFPFAEREPAYWQTLRAAFTRKVSDHHVVLVAPTRGTRQNWLRLAPVLAHAPFERIGHGLRELPAAPDVPALTPRSRLRLVVLGRLNGGKGEHLLRATLAAGLRGVAEIFLVGCGRAGQVFFGERDVHVIDDYARDDLPRLLAHIHPDAALLPATVAESFSYTLSELRALGIPVIATRLGAFAERIRDGEDGLLVAPDAASIVALVQQLQRDRAPLQRIRDGLRSHVAPSIGTMASAHRSLLPNTPGKILWHGNVDICTAMLAARTIAAERERDALRISDADKNRELLARSEWAQAQDREKRIAQAQVLNERAVVTQIQHALDDAHGRLGQLHRDFIERSEWAQSLDREVARLGVELVAAGTRHDAAQQEWTLAAAHFQGEVERLEKDKAELLASLSWRITAPLRALRRRGDRLRVQSDYQVKRATTAIPRLMRSLRVRGFGGTVVRMRDGPSGEAPLIPPPKPTLIEPRNEPQSFVAFTVPRADTPRASIIIPVYNKWHYSEACLRSLVAQAQRSSFEIIVVDDGSNDETPDRLAAIEGVIAIRNAENLGFVGSCNAGARMAHGEYLVFLNNDTQVAAHWLDALLDTFDQHERVGLVGAKLVYPDGRLQEAGGIVFNDGSGWNYGRFADPTDPSFNYVREADYCSGAAIAIARNLFDRIGGFDTRYAPAYYEDTDLAFEVRRTGLRVIYQPASTVFHFEGITSGTDPNSGVKRFQAINRVKFLDKWRDALALQPKAGQIDVAREHRTKLRVLIIDATTPRPDEDSGSVRLVNLIRVLIAHGNKVSFFAENRAFDGRYTQALQQLGVEALYHPYMPEPVRWFADHGALLDAVFVSRHYVAAPLVDAIRHYAPQAKLIFDTVDLHYLREEREAALAGRDDLRRSAAATKLAELRLVQKADITLVVSPIEQELLQREVPNARVVVLSNVHEIAPQRAPFEGRSDLFFVGGFQHQPNVDAMLWFVHSVWPLIERELPDARFHIAGSRMPETIKALAAPRVIVHGFLPTLEALLDGCRLSVAPLRYGAGVKGKVNQSMAHGQPVVATTVAAEGMYLRNEVDVLIGDDAETFAAQVVRLYSDAALWQRLSEGGLANIATHFSFAAATAALKRVLD